jgi:hypothetical protein
MSAVHWGLLLLGLFGLLTSSIYLGMVLLGARRFRVAALREEARLGRQPEFLPAISLFKPLHGDEVGLESNLRTFFEQDYLQHVAAAGEVTEENGVSRVEVLFARAARRTRAWRSHDGWLPIIQRLLRGLWRAERHGLRMRRSARWRRWPRWRPTISGLSAIAMYA